MSTWQELSDRRLVQIVLGYAAAGWLVLEGVDQLIGRALLPEVTYRLILVLYLGGIPAAAIIGWFHGERGHQRVPRLEVAMLVPLMLGIAGTAWWVARDFQEDRAPKLAESSMLDLRRLAVLYFEDLSEDGEFEYLADGLTESLIYQLDRVEELDVVSPNGVERYRGSAVTIDSIARALRAGTVIGGAVEPEGSRADGSPRQLRVTTRLYDGESGARMRQNTLVIPAENLLAARDSLGQEISRSLRRWLGQEVEIREVRRGTEDLTAWTLLQRAKRARRQAESARGAHDAEAADRAFDRADSLYGAAARADTAWAEPAIERGWLAYRQSRSAQETDRIVGALEEGLEHAETALLRAPRPSSPGHAEALELRGTLRYWKHLLHVVHDPAEQRALRTAAVEDLETASRLQPDLARAHSVLSHYYYTRRDLPSVLLAARTAYQEDAYLNDADKILWRLFLANYDIGQFNRAENWCEEGRSRFPGHPQLALCPLYLGTAPTTEPDVESAWRAYERVDSLLPEGQPHPYRNLAQTLVGTVLGRAGLADSARSVLVDARIPTEHQNLDPNLDLVALEAFARTRIGDQDTAIDLMKRYVSVNHGFERGGVRHWWWEDLREHPRFQELVTEGH